jgi:hypothetical protein
MRLPHFAPRRILCALMLAMALSLHALPAWASCTTHTLSYGGRMMTCTTCCFGNYCTTTCF